MEEATYNGWANHETWAVNLHLTNNEGDYLAACEAAERIVDAYESGADQREQMAEWVKNWAEEVQQSVIYPDWEPTKEARLFVADAGSLWRVDWYEIADGFIEEASK